MQKLLVLISSIAPCLSYAAGIPVSLVENPSPQFNGHTCQSYSLAILMASTGVPAFLAPTRKELRANELTIRAEIEKHAKTEFANDPKCSDIKKCITHSHWQKAVKTLTNSSKSLKIADVDFTDVPKVVAEKTGVGISMGIPAVQTSIARPVLISITSILNSSYVNASGEGSHIVTVLGSSRAMPAVSSSDSYQLLILNSAIKDGSGTFIMMCEEMPISSGDLKYSVGVSWVKNTDFKFKMYGQKTKVMWIE